jgi:hypothetical protein
MSTLSEVASQLKDALEHAQKAHAELETAKSKLEPLETAAKDANAKVNELMNQYQNLTMEIVPNPRIPVRRHGSGGAGKKRGPRTITAIALTTATRLMKSAQTEGKAKKAALTAALERVAVVASARSEKISDDIKAAIEKRADSIFKK